MNDILKEVYIRGVLLRKVSLTVLLKELMQLLLTLELLHQLVNVHLLQLLMVHTVMSFYREFINIESESYYYVIVLT